jgi:serine/threonine protein kinase/Flp pilus assembly protein TadD
MISGIVSHYKIISKIGSGGMGDIYQAEDIKLKRTVALKFLPPSFSRDLDAKKRLEHEAQAASSLDHSNICTIHEINETEDGQLFIAMAFYAGETLKEKIARGPIEINEAISITRQICEGLEKAHKSGIIHRDIKPANIFITDDGIVKILDFGLAKAKGHTQLTKMGTTVGTVAYMSPEQAKGGEVDKRTDIWSTGVVFYEMITGELPFRGDYEQAIIYSIINTEPDLSKTSDELEVILRKAFNKSSAERYQSADEMKSDLEALVNRTGSKGHSGSLRLKRIGLRTKVIAAALIILVLASVSYMIIDNTDNNSAGNSIRKMIVVLPFENLGPPEDEYFAKGMREEISNKLSSLSSLGVISRNSAEKYAKSTKSAKEIGKELGVDYILEGTIRWAGDKKNDNRVRIISQLVRTSDDLNVWSDSYDRIIDDIFDVQNEIAQNVVDKLGIKLLPNQQVAGPPPTTNIDAYDYYLKALLFHYGPTTGDNLKTCIKLYEKAISLDPGFAAAYAQISIAHMGLFRWYWDRDSTNLEKANIYLQKAKDLSPDIAEVHLAQFFFYAWFTHNEKGVRQELERVLEIQPNNAEALSQMAGFYKADNKFELAKRTREKAMLLDPLNARYPWAAGWDCYLYGEYTDAENYYKRAITISPEISTYYAELAELYVDWKGDTRLARQTLKNIKDEEYLDYDPNISIDLTILERDFDKALNQLKSSDKEYENSMYRYIPNSQMIALIYRFMEKDDLSRKYFNASVTTIEKMVLTKPEDPRFHFAISKSYAALGRIDEALSEVDTGIRLSPYVRESTKKSLESANLAIVYILANDYKNALKQIDLLLSLPSGFSINRLKLDPIYDPLRKLPGYKEIIYKYSL